jgi:voltage-gated potassium channel
MGQVHAMMQQLLGRFMLHIVLQPSMAMRALIMLLAVLAYGTTGFLYFERPGAPDLTWPDALWYCLVTMTTVGYGDYFPKTVGGRFFVGVPLLVLGIGLLGYLLSFVATTLITARNKETQGMNPSSAQEHVIVIHYPGPSRMIRLIDELLRDASIGPQTRIVLVDPDLPELPAELILRHVHYVRGDPARDETLLKAGLDRARHAVVLLRQNAGPAADALNVAVTLAIEARCEQVNTVVECIEPGTEELLRKAGADRIVCAARLDALTVTQELLNPGAQDILADLLSTTSGQQLYTAPVRFSPGCTVVQLRSSAAAKGHVLIGLQRAGQHILNPSDQLTLAEGDKAITIGDRRLADWTPQAI